MIECKYLFLGHHRCASTYVSSIFRDLAKLLGCSIETAVDFSDIPALGERQVDFFLLLNSHSYFVSKFFRNLNNTKYLHVVRDPRDLIISAYYSHLNSHPLDLWPELATHREKLRKLNKTCGIMAEMDFSRCFLNDLNSWEFKNTSNSLHVKMEELTADPFVKWLEIFKFMNIIDIGSKYDNVTAPRKSLTSDNVNLIVTKNSFEVKTGGRNRGVEEVTHHYRKGIHGDWKNHFNDELKDSFKNRHNDLLLKYGYENNAEW